LILWIHAKVINVSIDEADKKANVQVAEDQQSLAIGKGGQNVRLAAKLTGWKIDIQSVKKSEISTEVEKSETVTDKTNIQP